MYNTFLNAEISQARMYDVKLSEDEIYYLYQNPSEEGDSFAEHAMFFLDFNDIVTEGTHTTEWVPTQGALSQLDYCAQIEGNASIKAKVQLSDDKKTLLEEQTFVLQNGTNIIDLSGMNENAAYVRIVTEFVSDLNEVESHIPVLEKYDLKMTTGNKIWSTTAAWAQGTFAYAAGHQSADVYEWHRTDFDDFSGEVSAPDAPIESSSGGSGSSYSDHAISISTITNGSVNVSPKNAAKGETVTITVSPDAGYELDALTVTDKDGKAIRLTDKGNGKYTFTMTDGKVTVKATFAKTESKPEPVSSFTDVNADDWFAEAVQYVLDQGMMNGTSATSFSPDATTTRGMIVTILHRLEGEPTAAASDFSDVAAGTWYADAVAWAAENGVVNGVSKTSFAPNAPITREQLAAILFRYAQFKGYDVSVGEDTNILSYTDAGQISEYAIPAMQWACGAGVITGMGDGTLNPQGTATRAQVATMLMRFCESVEYDAAA